MKEFADDNFKFDENGKKLSKWVENTVGKGEIARYEQFLLFPQCFQKACFPGASKGVIVWEWVKHKYWQQPPADIPSKGYQWLQQIKEMDKFLELLNAQVEWFLYPFIIPFFYEVEGDILFSPWTYVCPSSQSSIRQNILPGFSFPYFFF